MMTMAMSFDLDFDLDDSSMLQLQPKIHSAVGKGGNDAMLKDDQPRFPRMWASRSPPPRRRQRSENLSPRRRGGCSLSHSRRRCHEGLSRDECRNEGGQRASRRGQNCNPDCFCIDRAWTVIDAAKAAMAAMKDIQVGAARGAGHASHGCPLRSAQIINASQCEIAASQLGKTYKGEFQSGSYTGGCSDLTNSRHAGIRFNPILAASFPLGSSSANVWPKGSGKRVAQVCHKDIDQDLADLRQECEDMSLHDDDCRGI